MKKFLIIVLFIITFPLFGETYYQNKNKFSISVPTATGGAVEVPSGKFVGGTYYASLVGTKKLSNYSGPTPSSEDIIYTYVAVSGGGGV